MPDKEAELIQQLSAKTKSRAVHWEPTANAEEFTTSFGGSVSFTIARCDDASVYGDTYRLVMRDTENREMLTLRTQGHVRQPGVDEMMSELYTAAKNEALKVDETLDSILEDLRRVS